MRIALISESPTLPTGFARTARLLADTLAEMGHDVTCYAIGAWGETFDRSLYNYRIWAAGDFDQEHTRKFGDFIRHVRPDLLLLNYDLITTLSWLHVCDQIHVRCPIVSHLVVDGLPVDATFLTPLSRCQALIVPGQSICSQIGSLVATPIYIFPHLVDRGVFRSVADARGLRRRLPYDHFVGVFAQNRPRKQLTQVLQGVKLLVASGLNCGLLLHTDRVNATRLGGEHLKRIIDYLDMGSHTIVTETAGCVDVQTEARLELGDGAGEAANVALEAMTVTEKMNLCDAIVVAPTCGGFEYTIIEANACGIPVCSTNDGGILAETAGGATYPLQPSFFDFTSYGAKAFRIAPETIADALSTVLREEAVHRTLTVAGDKNAQRFDRSTHLPRLRSMLHLILNGGNDHVSHERQDGQLERAP